MFLVCGNFSKYFAAFEAHAEALFDEVSSSCVLGASQSMLDTFRFLGAKNIQWAVTRCSALDGDSVRFEEFHKIYVKWKSLQQQSDGDIGESFAKALRCSAFDKALELRGSRYALRCSFAISQMTRLPQNLSRYICTACGWRDTAILRSKRQTKTLRRKWRKSRTSYKAVC